MNDPHVAALYYRLEHDDSVDYDSAPLLDGADSLLTFRLDNRQLTVIPKDHYANEEDAKDAVEDFIRGWEFDAAVESGSSTFRFRYKRAEIIDLHPEPSPTGSTKLIAKAGFPAFKGSLQIRSRRVSYPKPPTGPKRNPENEVAQGILSRLERFFQGRETLGTVAYFAVTALEDGAEGTETDDRKRAARYYKVSKKVLSKVAGLADGKGGSEARKYKGNTKDNEYTDDEKRFLVRTVQAFARRAAEAGENPPSRLEKITVETLRRPL